jgi:hypothetical protein
MMKEGNIQPAKVSDELGVTLQTARELIQHVQNRLEEDPRIGEKAFRGYPTLRLGPDYVVVSSISNLEKALQYSDLLRYILSNSESSELNRLCPKRAEKVATESAVITTAPLELDAIISEEQDDLFGYLNEEEEDQSEEVETVSEEKEIQRISTEQKQGTTYNYFKSRLQKFDPVTFDPSGSLYPKKCEQKHQPIILDDTDLKRIRGTPYDVKDGNTPEEKLVDIENPSGTIVCPEYWCMRDQIPLSDEQLQKDNGEIKCPVCHGKLQTRSTDNPRDFPLIKRETGFIYPGYVDYKSPRTQKAMPCCFKKPQSKTNKKINEDIYYILGEEKQSKEGRVAFLPQNIIQSLHINEKYELVKNAPRRLTTSNKGFFRTGLGHPSETLPKFLKLKVKIPSPRESVETVLKCSFLSTWKTLGTQHLSSIENDLSKINKDPIIQKELAKLISGIDEAFHKKLLTPLEELE